MGETFVQEHVNTDLIPYLFNAKELDEKMGYATVLCCVQLKLKVLTAFVEIGQNSYEKQLRVFG